MLLIFCQISRDAIGMKNARDDWCVSIGRQLNVRVVS